MRNIYLKISLASVLCFGVLSKSAHSFFISGFDPITPVAAAVDNTGVVSTAKEAYTHYEQLKTVDGALSSVTALGGKYLGKIGHKTSPGTLTIEECADVDIYDAVSIQGKVKKLFLEYPSDETLMKNKYHEKALEFYEDTIMEIDTAADLLAKQLAIDIQMDIEQIETDIKEGGNGLKTPDDGYNSVEMSSAKAYETFDNLLGILQQAVALKVQLRTSRIMVHQLKPFYVPDPSIESEYSKKTDAASTEEKQSSAVYGGEIKVAFAQVFERSNLAVANNRAEVVKEEEAVSTQPIAKKAKASTLFDFVAPPSAKIDHPFIKNKSKMDELNKLEPLSQETDVAMEVHNVMQNLKGFKDSAKNYKRMKDLHDKSLELLAASDKCAIQHLGRHFNNPENVWSGRPLGDQLNEYELRGGISGWAVQAFSAAKAAEISPVSTDDLTVININTDRDMSDISKTDDLDAIVENQPSFFSSPSKQEQYEKDNREINLVSWQIGAEAAKMLSQNPQKWGNVKKRYPIWNDTKSFYNQYLSGKYDNIADFLKAIDVNDIKAQVSIAMGAQGGTSKEMIASREKKILEIDTQLSNNKQNIQNKKAQSIKQAEAKIARQIASLEKQKAEIGKKMDASANIAKQSNAVILDKKRELEDASMLAIKQKETYYDTYDTEVVEKIEVSEVKNQTLLPEEKPVTTFAPQSPQFITEIRKEVNDSAYDEVDVQTSQERDAQYSQITQKLNSGSLSVNDIQKNVVKENNNVESYQKQIALIDEKIAQIKLASKQEIEEISKGFANEIIKADEMAASQKSKINDDFLKEEEKNNAKLISSAMASGPAGLATVALIKEHIPAATNSAIGDLYEKIDKRIAQTKKELSSLGDELYMPESHHKVVDIHKRLIDDLKALPLTVRNPFSSSILLTLYMYQELLPADTSIEEEAYFIGSKGKERDMKAPKSPPASLLPNMREVVYFDSVDKKNIQPLKSKDGKSLPVSRTDFLKYGADIPEIWKQMLQDKAFVEKDFNLQAALNTGCSQQAFFQGGQMPCQLKGSNAVLNVNAAGQYVVDFSSGLSGLNVCSNIEYKGRSGLMKHRLYDKKADGEILAFGLDALEAKDEYKHFCSYSELGTLFDADSANNLRLRKKTNEAFEFLEEINARTNTNKEIKSEERAKDEFYSNAVFSKNQIGDFLKAVEQEQKLRKNMEEVKQKNDEAMAMLKELLARFGFEMADNIDLNKDSDYELIRRKLEGLRSSKIAAANRKIKDVNTNDNEVVAERLEEYQLITKALHKDKDATSPITGAVVVDNTLDEDIKSSKVNRAVIDEHDKKADADLEKEMKAMSAPFCAAY